MKSDERNSILLEFIGTLKYAGWIAAVVFVIIAVLFFCGK